MNILKNYESKQNLFVSKHPVYHLLKHQNNLNFSQMQYISSLYQLNIVVCTFRNFSVKQNAFNNSIL